MRAAVLALVIAVPATARAFTDPKLYQEGVATGGADHRYFTGSHADKYACTACHEGGGALALDITGLPDGVPAAGVKYDVRITWDDPDRPVSVQLELTSHDGTHPTVTLPDPLPAEARCDRAAAGDVAEYSFDEARRRIVGVKPCNAGALLFSFIGTGEPLDLAIAGVRSDASETPAGDDTFELRQTLGVRLAASGGACDAGGGAGWLVGLAVLRASRRRRAR